MAHPAIGGHTPPENAWIAFRWILTWLFACGIPLALSMALPKWVKMDGLPGQDLNSQTH